MNGMNIMAHYARKAERKALLESLSEEDRVEYLKQEAFAQKVGMNIYSAVIALWIVAMFVGTFLSTPPVPKFEPLPDNTVSSRTEYFFSKEKNVELQVTQTADAAKIVNIVEESDKRLGSEGYTKFSRYGRRGTSSFSMKPHTTCVIRATHNMGSKNIESINCSPPRTQTV